MTEENKFICHIGTLEETGSAIKITSDLNKSIGSGYFYVDGDKDCGMAALDLIEIIKENKGKDFAIDLSSNIFVLYYFIKYLIRITFSNEFGPYISTFTICVNNLDEVKKIDEWIKEEIKNNPDHRMWK